MAKAIKVRFYDIKLEHNVDYIVECLQDGENFEEIASSVHDDFARLEDGEVTLEVGEDEDFLSDNFRYFCLSDSICGAYTNVKSFDYEILKED